jgi:hypothetical protein
VNDRYKALTGLASQADNPFEQYEVAELQQKLRQQVLYERFVPVREIYHFGNQFLNGYTPQKMQAVRGYFDQVFEGKYSKSIPADKQAAILESADAKYVQQSGKKVNREDMLWKTLRNVEASEKYPDLWTQFRQDLSQGNVMPMVVGSKDPNLGSNALNRPSKTPDLEDKSHTGHGRSPEVFDPNEINVPGRDLQLDIPHDTAHRDHEEPAVTNVFRTEAELDASYGELRLPAPPGIKDFEQANGQIIRNPELQIIKPGQKALPLEEGKKYIWVVDRSGNLRIGVEAEVAPGERLGHPTLVEDGQARVGGEIVFNKETKQWRINDRSGRYSRGAGRTVEEKAEFLDNAHELFSKAGLDVGIKYSK